MHAVNEVTLLVEQILAEQTLKSINALPRVANIKSC